MLNHIKDQVPAVLVEWVVAERAGDAGGISDRLTEDFVAVGPLGFLLSKPEWLDRHATGALTYDAFEIEEPGLDVRRRNRAGDLSAIPAWHVPREPRSHRYPRERSARRGRGEPAHRRDSHELHRRNTWRPTNPRTPAGTVTR
jgi:hypothetical protein